MNTNMINRGGLARSSDESAVMAVERRGWAIVVVIIRQLETGGSKWVLLNRSVFRNM